jgi:hypothetical protein
MPGPRLLLVEITNADQFPGQIRRDLPLLAGFVTAHGAALRWLRFGLATTNQLRHGRDEVTLPPPDLATLLEAARTHAPTRLLSTHALAPGQHEALTTAVPGLALEVLPASVPADVLPGARFRARDGLEGDAWGPAYTWQVANAGAAVHDNVALFLKSHCGYARPIAENPVYAALVAEGVPLADGCAFCGNAAGSRAPTPAAWLRRQVEALAADRGPTRAPKALLCEHLGGRAELEALAGALADTGLDACTTLHLGVRTDALARLEPVLRAHLAARPNARLGVYATGLESFVPADLERFHKGTTAEDGLRAVELLRGMKRDFPGRFEATGLTMILLTPWTTPADLLTNLRTVQRLGLADEIGNLFAARLRLHPGRAITALARRQGHVVDDEPDPLLATNRRKLFGRELAWRFADPRLEPLGRLYVRLDEATADADDALSVHVRAALAEALGAPRRDWMAKKLEVLIACAEAVEAAPEPLPEAEVLARGLARLPVTARAPASEPAPTAPAAGREPLLRLTFTRRRGADAVVLRVTEARPDQPAYRRVGALAISHESPADAKGFARLVELVAAAASRTPPALDDAAAWRGRLEGLLEVTRLANTYTVTVGSR